MIKHALIAAAFASLACTLTPLSGAQAMPSASGGLLTHSEGAGPLTQVGGKGKNWNRSRASGRNPGRHLGWYKQRRR